MCRSPLSEGAFAPERLGVNGGHPYIRPLAGRTRLSVMLSDPQGVVYLYVIFIPRSFGLHPPTRGLQHIGPLRGPCFGPLRVLDVLPI